MLTILPLIFSITLSMTSLSYSSLSGPRFVWFENYVDLLSDDRFLRSLWQSGILIFGPLVFQLIFGFCLALVMNERLPGLGWLRVIFIVPMFFPPIVMGLMWKVLFTPQLGGINHYLGAIGIDGPQWLSNPSSALTAIVIAAVWGWTPFVTIMFYTAMQTFPKDLYEAARIDGATWSEQIRFVTLPLLRDTAVVVIVFRIMEGLAIFPIIYVMTNGGPAGSTETTNYYAFISGFEFLQVGYASAIILSFLAILVAILAPSTGFLLRGAESDGDAA
ncbi:carbohydrate ABC transporter permease [Palleronia aestuarii]|uniref:carbohydrate ABC transporter permease n=1 Tax=Palleronia aestuarii TaxID=568105 RepID=UPI0011B4635D|nr:sugar ABC transporter permease [Palleronia aestuarii]